MDRLAATTVGKRSCGKLSKVDAFCPTDESATLASGCPGARPPLLRALKLREAAAHLHHHAACPVLILPGANVFSRVGFKLTYLACFRFSLDVVHMVANYLVTLRIEDHE